MRAARYRIPPNWLEDDDAVAALSGKVKCFTCPPWTLARNDQAPQPTLFDAMEGGRNMVGDVYKTLPVA